jgi:hypothetical protein
MLSVCLIAKNEAENISRAIRSVRDIADEIVVLDTGSSDGTQDIARDAGAVVIPSEWQDDFSAAYNEVISYAKGEWIFQLDCDEELISESHPEIRDRITEPDVLAFSILRDDFYTSNQFSTMYQVRMFRNRPELRFRGRIHHQFRPSLDVIATQLGMRFVESTIRIRHYGYLGEDKTKKLKRAEHLMELELLDRPQQFYFLVELGRTKLALGDSAGVGMLAEAALLACNKASDSKGPQLAILLEHVLAANQLPDGFPIDHHTAREWAGELFPRSIPLLWQIAQADFAHGRFRECADRLRKIIQLRDEDRYDKSSSFDPRIMGDDAELNLAVCLIRLGEFRPATLFLNRLLNSPTRSREARMNLEAIRRFIR